MPLSDALESERSSEERGGTAPPTEGAVAPGKLTRAQLAPLSGAQDQAARSSQRDAAAAATQRLAPWVMDEGMQRATGTLEQGHSDRSMDAAGASAPPIPATKVAAAGSRKLAAAVDQLRRLDDESLLQRRKEASAQVAEPRRSAAERERATREHDAIELVCAERGLGLPGDSSETTLALIPRSPAIRWPEGRAAMRELLERQIAEHGSYAEARRQIARQLDSPMTHASHTARQLGREQLTILDEEAAQFRKAFSIQAMQTARAMLDDGSRAIAAALGTYGLPVDTVRLTAAAERMQDGEASGAAADWLALAHSGDQEARLQDRAPQRRALAAAVDRLQQRQAVIARLAHEQDRLLALRARGEHASHHGAARRGQDLRDARGMDEARRAAARSQGQVARLPPLLAGSPVSLPGEERSVEARLTAIGPMLREARLQLTSAWIEAEREHPLLAAYRSGGAPDPAAASQLGSAGAGREDEQLRAALQQVMPKLANILRAKAALASGDLSPLTLPPVVELARAQMLVPPGSLRAAAIADLVEEASRGGWKQWAIAAITLATTAISLVPTAGASVILATNLSALALEVYVAVESYEEYGLRTSLVNTDLDQARSLSAEEPSLTRLAVQLVSLGLGSAVVAQLFHQAVTVRRLALSGGTSDAAARALDRLGEQHGLPHLGEEVAREARAGGTGGRAGRISAEATTSLEGLAQIPGSYPWNLNPEGVTRTLEEAIDLAREHGVEIADDVIFMVVKGEKLPKNTYARYFRKRYAPHEHITWENLVTRNDQIPIELSEEVLKSDEAIVAVVAHELHEVEGLRSILLEQGGLSHAAIFRLISPGFRGNLHDEAWDVADAFVAKMRNARRAR